MNVHYRTLVSRLERDGYTDEEAMSIPPNVPRWVWHIEQREGRSLREILEEAARRGRKLTYLADAYEVPYERLRSYVRKWGIKFGWHNRHG